MLINYMQETAHLGSIIGSILCLCSNTNIINTLQTKSEPRVKFETAIINVISGGIVGYIMGPVTVPILPFYAVYLQYYKNK